MDTSNPPDRGGPESDSAPIDPEQGVDAPAPIPLCSEVPGSGTTSGTITDDGDEGTARATGPMCQRRFSLSSTATLRDNLPVNPREVIEAPKGPALSTRNTMFDALYALALEEVAENSVASIVDGGFDDGKAHRCPPGGCFETGRKWTYVWTRDSAYAIALGLGALDPRRARNSLEFKTSTLRSGGRRQIVQDTGTGGSYPVSSDRVVWALGAREVLQSLTGSERLAFRDLAYEALSNTLEQDRAVVYDADSGLYRGEESFLDWREQSYPQWVKDDPVHIAMSRSLSTNVGHLAACSLAADLAGERGDGAHRARYQKWADDLRVAIAKGFYLADSSAFSAFIPSTLDPAPGGQLDLLGLSLAILHDVATPQQAKDAISAYPVLPKGPPVLFPQQQDVPIYHNRGIWPFVTAFWMKAAKKVRNDRAVALGVRSLMRGAALNLSNMENLELVTGRPFVKDGDLSGPVINSQRQLWSVAAYVAMVHQVIFGIELTSSGLALDPYLPKILRSELFGQAEALALYGYPHRGHKLTLILRLPPTSAAKSGAYTLERIWLDGKDIGLREIATHELKPESVIEVQLADRPQSGAPLKVLPSAPGHEELFAPRGPSIDSVALVSGALELAIDRAGEDAARVEFAIYRDGVRVSTQLPGDKVRWRDPNSGNQSPSHCYSVETSYKSSGNRSQRSKPICYWGGSPSRVRSILARDFEAVGGQAVTQYGRFHYQGWGDADHELRVKDFSPTFSGMHLFQAVAGNGAGPISTGITCAVKRLEVFDNDDGTLVGGGYWVMPQLGRWDRWGESSFVRIPLRKGKHYRIVVRQDGPGNNMSVLTHFARYTGGNGGITGSYNRVNIAEIKVLALNP